MSFGSILQIVGSGGSAHQSCFSLLADKINILFLGVQFFGKVNFSWIISLRFRLFLLLLASGGAIILFNFDSTAGSSKSFFLLILLLFKIFYHSWHHLHHSNRLVIRKDNSFPIFMQNILNHLRFWCGIKIPFNRRLIINGMFLFRWLRWYFFLYFLFIFDYKL